MERTAVPIEPAIQNGSSKYIFFRLSFIWRNSPGKHMASLLGQLHFWTLRKLAAGTGLDIGTHIYHEKGATNVDGYQEYKRQWAESRGISWSLKNRRPEKLRDSLRECESNKLPRFVCDGLTTAGNSTFWLAKIHGASSVLFCYKCQMEINQKCSDGDPWEVFRLSFVLAINARWISMRSLKLLLSNGIVLVFSIGNHSSDVEKIIVDKSLVGKIPEHIYSAAVSENFMVFSLQEQPKLIYVHIGKKPGLESKKAEKLSAQEMKVSVVDLPGPTSKRVTRNLSLNSKQEMIVVWWQSQSEEVWPWSPMTGEMDRANMIIFAITGAKLEMLCYVRTECDPIHAQFSYNQPHHVYTIEQSAATGGESSIDSCIYEYTRNKIERVTVTSIPLKAPIVVQQRNHTEDKLLIGCEDGTLMLYDDHRRVTQITKASLIPSQIQWHPTDSVVVVCSSRGEIQVFDMGLAPVSLQLLAENPFPQLVLEINKHFLSAVNLHSVTWSCEAAIGNTAENSIGCHDNLLLLFESGPLCLFRMEFGVKSRGRLGAIEMVSEYIAHNQAEEAVNFLSSMNWNTDGSSCFACMNLIMTFLLKLPLNSTREGLLEDTLGCFYAPSRPLSDVTVLQFRDQISRLSRRFFHHLLRYQRFEKAFLLAVDIGAKDLFMDIHYLATDVGNQALADVAKQRAIEIDNELLTSDTGESYEDDVSYEDDELEQSKEGNGITENCQDSYLDMQQDAKLLDGQQLHQTEQTALHSEGLYNNSEEEEGLDGEQLPTGGALKIVHFGVV